MTDTVTRIDGLPCYVEASFHVGNVAISDTVHVPGMLPNDVEKPKAKHGSVTSEYTNCDEMANALSAGG